MLVTGKMTIFVKVVGEGENAFKKYSSNVGSKDKAGVWHNAPINVRFAGDSWKDKTAKMDVMHAYQFDLKNAFLDCEEFTTKEGEIVKRPILVILEADLTGCVETKKREMNSKDLPF